MNGGDLKQKIKFVRYDYVSDGSGGQIATPVEVLNTWAKVSSIKSVKTLEALQEALNKVYKVVIRMRKNFEPQSDYSVFYKGKEMVILTIESDEIENREWILTITDREG